MKPNLSRMLVCAAVIAAGGSLSACSTSGSNTLTCASTEVAPNSQPGSTGPKSALDWYLKHGKSGLPSSGFRLTGSSPTRSVFSDGSNQISVGALPADKGQPRIWVVLMTYDCS